LTPSTKNTFPPPGFETVITNVCAVGGLTGGGVDVTLYDTAPVDTGHVRSIVVVNGLLVVTLATAGESVYTAAGDAVIVPDPDALIDVIVNVY